MRNNDPMLQPIRTVAFVLAVAPLVLYCCTQALTADPTDSTTAAPTGSKSKECETAKRPKAKLYDSGYMDDNQPCMVCHLDFEEEKISAVHLKAGMTCAACHGDSEPHRGDEWNIVRPDVIWGRAEMGPFCKQCHPKHKKGKVYDEFLAKWLDKRRPTGRWVTKDSACLDCHGNHAVTIPEGQFK